MEITFQIDDATASYSRNWFSGRETLTVDEQEFKLQSPWNPATHFGVRLTKVRKMDVRNHKIKIEHVRPLLFAGFRKHAFRVIVDDAVVAEKIGR